MNQTLVPILCVAALWTLNGCHQDPETLVRGGYDEQQMEEAIQRAKRELPEFLAALQARAGSDFAVKTPIKDGDEIEHFWVTGVVFKDAEFHGEIGNDAGIVKGIKLGQKWSVTTNDVSDWMYFRDEKMHGNYTMRPLLKTMDAAEAARWRKQFAKP